MNFLVDALPRYKLIFLEISSSPHYGIPIESGHIRKKGLGKKKNQQIEEGNYLQENRRGRLNHRAADFSTKLYPRKL